MTKILVDSELLKWALRVVDTVLPDYQEYRRLSYSLRAALDAATKGEKELNTNSAVCKKPIKHPYAPTACGNCGHPLSWHEAKCNKEGA